ncbi:hypothetical protein GXW83_33490 [Streptacidiphilus sp. PB12-B1b]|uniref:DUF6049 family protein n=1 Tax=Streptacidiphilus sp. PB12-B1b TaxID=2705012 RepID=UPI0015FB2EAE|nr:DUF6049 family protein [Streptacidiphilus sp. PB12-B1b]QMU79885.1 hypothetical protein GXW83_33490 [Streptacidiphilus sp. PB12-B1b]
MGEAARQRRRTRGLGAGRTPLDAPGRLRSSVTVLLAAGLTLLGGAGLAPAAEASQLRVGPATAVQGTASAAAAPVTARAASSVSQTYPAVVSLTDINPPVPVAGGKISITGTVRNSGSSTINALQVGLAVGSAPLDNRSSIAAVAQETTPQPNQDAPELSGAPTAQLGPLVPGATSTPFTLTVSVDDLGLSSDGVYELDVDATTGGSSPRPLGVSRTFLPYHPSTSAKPTQVATLWPLVDQPRVQAQQYRTGAADLTGQAVLTDDTLASELGPEGRLGQLQSLGSSSAASAMKLTWVIDPDLISTVNQMRSGYRVVSDPQGSVSAATPDCNCTRKGSEAGVQAAKSWLLGMQQALLGLSPQQIISLPYADPDLATLAHHSPAADTLASQLTDVGDASVPDLLQVTADSSVAWPYQGYTDASVVALARRLHDTQIVTNSSSLPYTGVNFTPNAARSLGDGTTAVVADSTISDIFSGDLTTKSAQTMAEQRFLAETLEITDEQPGLQRSILVQPPRTMSTSTADTLLASLEEAAGKWIEPESYGTVAAAKPTPNVSSSLAPYSVQVRNSELQTLPDVMAIQDDLAELQKIITPPDPYGSQFDAAILRSVSTQWRGQPQAGEDYQSDTQAYLTGLLDSVSILGKPNGVTLPGSNSATIPITIENNLPQTLTNLVVVLTSKSPNRLAVEGSGRLSVTNAGNTKPGYKFQVKAAANGKVTMEARLYTTVGDTLEPYTGSDAAITFTVNVTQISGGVIAVIAGGGLLVVLAGLRLYWKRRKDAAQTDGGPGETDGEDGADEPHEPQPGADQGADCGQPGGHDPENGVQSPV